MTAVLNLRLHQPRVGCAMLRLRHATARCDCAIVKQIVQIVDGGYIMPSTRRQFLGLAAGTVAGLAFAPVLSRAGIRAAQAQAIPDAPTFKGAAGKSFVGPVTLSAAVTVLRAQHNGTGNFVVNVYIPNDGFSPADAFNQAQVTDSSLVYDVIGSYKGGSAIVTAQNADYYLYVNASGAWQISVEQPIPENIAPQQATTFSSKGQDITPYFTLPDGISQISLQADPSSAITGTLFHIDDLGGEAVQAGVLGHYGETFQFLNPDNQVSFPFTPSDAGPYIFFVTNDIKDTTAWTVSFA
jgi:hypothetical protein